MIISANDNNNVISILGIGRKFNTCRFT